MRIRPSPYELDVSDYAYLVEMAYILMTARTAINNHQQWLRRMGVAYPGRGETATVIGTLRGTEEPHRDIARSCERTLSARGFDPGTTSDQAHELWMRLGELCHRAPDRARIPPKEP